MPDDIGRFEAKIISIIGENNPTLSGSASGFDSMESHTEAMCTLSKN